MTFPHRFFTKRTGLFRQTLFCGRLSGNIGVSRSFGCMDELQTPTSCTQSRMFSLYRMQVFAILLLRIIRIRPVHSLTCSRCLFTTENRMATPQENKFRVSCPLAVAPSRRILGLDGSQPSQENWASLDSATRAQRAVYVGVGGGHYAPRCGDLARMEGRYLGHMLASYALDFKDGGRWREAVTEAVRSTRAAFPGAGGGVDGGVAALIDKKAFKSADRSSLLEHLADIGVEHRFKSSDC